MKSTIFTAASLAAMGLGLPAPSFAQQTTPGSTDTRWTMPYETKFWGYGGINLGRSKLDASCPAGASCDQKDTVWKIYGGGRFNNILGGEIGLMDFGKFERGGGTTKAQGFDVALTAGLPIGENSSVFLKGGTAYTRTDVSGVGLTTGKENGWGPRYGIGAQAAFTRNWAVRLDMDRYRIQVPGAKTNLDTFTVGAQYTFR
jgi:opacity protein-like surface antigen